MKGILAYAIYLFADLLTTAMVVQAIMSWFVRDPYSPLGRIYLMLDRFTGPIVEPFRRFMSRFNTGMVDFSMVVAILAIQFISNLLIRLVYMF